MTPAVIAVAWAIAVAQAPSTGTATPVPASRLLARPANAAPAPSSDGFGPRKLVAPEALATAGHRVHVFASEELDADSLGALARPGVVLWLHTRSNTLRPAIAAKLRRFDEAWVEVRPPLKSTQLEPIARAPRAGLWFRSAADLSPPVARLAVRRLAVDLDGPLDEASGARFEALDVDRIRWVVPSVDLESFGRFAQLPAQKSLVLPPGVQVPRCEAGPVETLASISVIAPPSGVPALTSCGFTARIPVEPDVDVSVLGRIFQQAPTAELEVQVGQDDRRAMRTRRLLERLEAASGTRKPSAKR